MITLLLLGADSAPLLRLGPMPGARVVGDFMESATDARPLLVHRRGAWSSGAVVARRVRVDSVPLRASFFDSSGAGPALSPVDGVVFFDGALYAEDGARLLARYEESAGLWREMLGGRLWSRILLAAPGFAAPG